MNVFAKAALAGAILMTTAITHAATITCQGTTKAGNQVTFTHQTNTNSSVTVSILETQEGKEIYQHSWDSDESSRERKVNGITLVDSAGDRGEYYSKLVLVGNQASLTYEENDSGWDYMVLLQQLTCEAK